MPYVEHKTVGGLNLKSAASDIQDGQLQVAEGCRFDKSGAVSSEQGRTLLRIVAGDQVRGIVEVIRDGVKSRIVKAGTTLYEDGVSIGTFSGTGTLRGVSVDDRVYLSDGTNIGTWDGTTLLTTIGITAPTTAPTWDHVNATGTLGEGTYGVAYTFVINKADGDWVAESNFSPITSKAFDASDDTIRVSAIEATPTGVTHVRFYRTDKNKPHYFFVTEVTAAVANALSTTNLDFTDPLPAEADSAAAVGDDITDVPRSVTELLEADRQEATFTGSSTLRGQFPQLQKKASGPLQAAGGSQVVMTNLGALADWLDHDPGEAGFKGMIAHQGQLFTIKDNQVRFSRVNEPEHWPITSAFEPGRKSSETLQAILPLGGNIVCYTDVNIYVLAPVGLSFEDGRIIDMHSPVGLAAPEAVAPLLIGSQQEAGHIFLAKSGVYLFDGTRVREISFDVESIFTDSGNDDAISIGSISSATAVAHRDKVFISYTSTGTANDRTLMMDFQDPQNVKMQISKYGYTAFALEKNSLIPVGGDSDGKVYQVDTGNTNGGSDLNWNIRTKQFPLTTNNTLVALESLVLDVDFGGLPTTITVRTDTGRTSSFTDQSSGRTRIVRDLPHTIKGRRVDVEVSSSGQTERNLFGIGFNYRPGLQPHG